MAPQANASPVCRGPLRALSWALSGTACLAVLAACSGGGDGLPLVEPPPPPPGALFEDASSARLPGGTGTRNMDAASVDVDGDGDPDLVIAREHQSSILLLNNGAGVFATSPTALPLASHDYEDIAVADFDRDGDQDLAVAAEDDKASQLWLNNGNGTFTDATARLPRRGTCNSVLARDFDRDGDADLMFGNAGLNFLFTNDGAGQFTDETATRLPQQTDVTHDLEAGDVDADGDLDVVVGNLNGPRMWINDGTGTFVNATGRIPPRTGVESSREVELVDLDRDQDLDLFMVNVSFGGGDPQDRVLINNGQGVFADETAARLGTDNTDTLDAEFLDVDGDLDLDLVTASMRFTSKPYRSFLNDGTGRFTETETVLPAGITGEGIDIEVADFNRDGRPDMFLSAFTGTSRMLIRRP